ncbi:MAG: hypothetical protein HFG49_04705 [Lachnospiraceae bacterium]|jgi:hypothetical protein|nr:hypothetical protein [Lachnospiraceae bacterium]
MPYCPKCDMEFIEGIQVCTDCGQPLYESKEAAQAAMKQEEEEQFEESVSQAPLDFPEKAQRTRPAPSVYVKKSAQYQDMKSSAFAFLLVGGFALAFAMIGLLVLIPAYSSNNIFVSIGAGVLGCFGLVCLFVCLKTNQSAARMKKEADAEAEETNRLITQFLNVHSATEIDNLLENDSSQSKESSTDTPEEFILKRYELIQDFLITEQDLPDPSYVDFLCEEIYNRMYGQEE